MRRRVLERLARLERQSLDARRLALAAAAGREDALRRGERELYGRWVASLREPPQEAALVALAGSFTEATRRQRAKLAEQARLEALAVERLTREVRERRAEVKRYELLAERAAAREREERLRRWANELDELAATRRRR